MTSMGATEPAARAATASSPPAAPGGLGPSPVSPASGVPAAVVPGVGPDAEASAAPRRFGHRPELDGLRGLAVLVVVLHHVGVLMWPGHPEWFFRGGQVGVDLFFALSGFLITALLLTEHRRRGRIRVGDFLRRRLLRLWPALVVLQVGMLAASVATDRYPPGEVLSSALRVLTFSTNADPADVLIEVGHTWSLSVEAHFYVLWCIAVAVVLATARRPYPVLAGLAALGVAAPAIARALAFSDDGGVTAFDLYVGSPYRLDGPLVGALFGVAWSAGWLDRIPARWAARAIPVALLGLAWLVVGTHPLSPILFQGLFTGAAALGAVVVVGVLCGGRTLAGRLLGSRPLAMIGAISYSVYLWHLPVIMFLARNTTDWDQSLQITLAIAVSFALGVLSYRYVERPFLRRKAGARADG
ncbi:MAG TPA: acyltransferase [Acidimicrobiales bacterium]|nr:acyltransferase [Acidimicrobiales bacterium]